VNDEDGLWVGGGMLRTSAPDPSGNKYKNPNELFHVGKNTPRSGIVSIVLYRHTLENPSLNLHICTAAPPNCTVSESCAWLRRGLGLSSWQVLAGKSAPAPDLMQIGQPESAPRKGVCSFPQAIPFVWQVDARIVNKTQYVVVFC
jgi:hypothetical protein